METNSKLRLWRVEIRSIYGYDAPSILVEAKLADVHKEVRKLNLRLLDFPEKWSYHLTDLKKEFNSKKGKWI
jgi:hypothetical protein